MNTRFCFITTIRKNWSAEEILAYFGKKLDFVNWNCVHSEEFREMQAEFDEDFAEMENPIWRKELLFYEEVQTKEYVNFIVSAFKLQTIQSLVDFFPNDEKWKNVIKQQRALCGKIIEQHYPKYPKDYNKIVKSSKFLKILNGLFVALVHFYFFLFIAFVCWALAPRHG